MGPDVERLIGQLEQAEDAVSGRAARVSIPGDDAVLMKNLVKENSWFVHCHFEKLEKPVFFLFFFFKQTVTKYSKL